MYCVHIKQKKSLRIQIIIDQAENLKKFLSLRNVIQTVTDTDYSTDSSIQFKLLHILLKIQNILSGLHSFLHSLCKHLSGIVHSNHIIPPVCKQSRHRSGAAAKFQYQTILDPIFLKMICNIVCPFFVIDIVHEQIVNLCKFLVCAHSRLPCFYFMRKKADDRSPAFLFSAAEAAVDSVLFVNYCGTGI